MTQLIYQCRQASSDQGLATSEPYLGNAVRDKDSCQPFDFRKRQHLGTLDPLIFIEWHAIGASEVAPVGNGYSQATQRSL